MDMSKQAAEESKGEETFRIKNHPNCRLVENHEHSGESSGKGQTREEAGTVKVLVFLRVLDSFSQWGPPPLSALVLL